jgi:hypothetical protein
MTQIAVVAKLVVGKGEVVSKNGDEEVSQVGSGSLFTCQTDVPKHVVCFSQSSQKVKAGLACTCDMLPH